MRNETTHFREMEKLSKYIESACIINMSKRLPFKRKNKIVKIEKC